MGFQELNKYDRVLVGNEHEAGGTAGRNYLYLGSDGSELDLGAQDYTSSSWADLDGQSTYASNDGSETLSPYDTVTVSGDHTAGGDPGQVYLYTGVAGSVDLSAVDYESSSDWDLVLSESAPLVESGFGRWSWSRISGSKWARRTVPAESLVPFIASRVAKVQKLTWAQSITKPIIDLNELAWPRILAW